MVLAFIGLAWLAKAGPAYFSVAQWIVVPLIIITLTFTAKAIGVAATYWLYPVIVSFYFFLPMKGAVAINSILITIASIVGWNYLESYIAIRFIITMVSVAIFITIFIFVIEQLTNKLEKFAKTDVLTGLLNRSTLKELLNKAIEQNKRANIPMTIISIDLDRFKNINDEFGHDAGDEVLINVSQTLSKGARATDSIFRVGGEEFLIILFDTDLADGIKKAEQLRQALIAFKGRITTASFGVAEYQKDETFEHWLKHADNNLYKAKSLGRNRVTSDLDLHRN